MLSEFAQKSWFAVFPLSIFAILWGGSIAATVSAQGRSIEAIETVNVRQDIDIGEMNVLMGRIDERLKALQEGQIRIENRLFRK